MPEATESVPVELAWKYLVPWSLILVTVSPRLVTVSPKLVTVSPRLVTLLLVSVNCEKLTASLGATPSATLVIVVPPVWVLLS
ncbi:hypothetical protein D3C78_1814740 [compost metagenome]